ncbi:hypothetical protein [uncultured Ruegeria sp.]|uniref:hypothetical protein n=1 Tax=uncultured Ruegeria sp. TaxID=259304 RepID=UPI002603DF2C|nr:hypothetical protein [uncultured Ruegeria sp.]
MVQNPFSRQRSKIGDIVLLVGNPRENTNRYQMSLCKNLTGLVNSIMPDKTQKRITMTGDGLPTGSTVIAAIVASSAVAEIAEAHGASFYH